MSTSAKLSLTAISNEADRRQRSSREFHLGNIAVLFVCFLVVGWFVFFYAGFQTSLARLGRVVMVVLLGIRVVLEVISWWRLTRLDPARSTRVHTQRVVAFRHFRRWLHGPITVAIIAGYTVGFGLLLSEFYSAAGLELLLLALVSYVAGAAVLIIQIRKKISRERDELRSWTELLEEIA